MTVKWHYYINNARNSLEVFARWSFVWLKQHFNLRKGETAKENNKTDFAK